jgi:hypothetical protein
MTQDQIDGVRAHDRRAKVRYFDQSEQAAKPADPVSPGRPKSGFWSWLSRLWS